MLQVLEKILATEKQQLIALEEGNIARAVKLDRYKKLLYEKLARIEEYAGLYYNKKTREKKIMLAETEFARAKTLIKNILDINKKISELIETEMKTVNMGLNKIEKLRRAFCLQTTYRAQGTNISISA